MVAGSPGVGGMSNSSSSSGASWRSGTPSPPLFEEGVPSRNSPCPATAHPSQNQPHYAYNASGTPGSTPGGTPIITLDEGIVPDYIEEQHPRKKVSNLFSAQRRCSFTTTTTRTINVGTAGFSSILHVRRRPVVSRGANCSWNVSSQSRKFVGEIPIVRYFFLSRVF